MLNYLFRHALFTITLIIFVSTMHCQQTSTTNCNVYGNNVSCTTNTTDYGAQQQRAYEQGQQIGNALGNAINRAMAERAYKKNMERRLSDSDKALIAESRFMDHHKNYVREESNSKILSAYIKDHRLDPREQKSWERAFKETKGSGQLDLYSKR